MFTSCFPCITVPPTLDDKNKGWRSLFGSSSGLKANGKTPLDYRSGIKQDTEDLSEFSSVRESDFITPSDILQEPTVLVSYNDVKLGMFEVELPQVDWERYMKARKGDYGAAARMLRSNLIWQQENLPVEKHSVMNELNKGKFFHYGYDNDDRPIVVYMAHKHFPKTSNADEVVRMLVYVIEAAMASRPNKLVQQFTFLLYTPKGSNMDLKLIKKAAKTFQDNYPERMNRFIIFPIGPVVHGLFGMAKPFLDAGLRAKICMLKSRDPPQLHETIPAQTLREIQERIDIWDNNKGEGRKKQKKSKI